MNGQPIFLEPIALYYYPFNPTYEETLMSFPKIDTYGVYIRPIRHVFQTHVKRRT